MSTLSPRLQIKVAQKQILTPGLVQMVTVLQLNRLELKDMITTEMSANPFLEEGEGDEITPQELQSLLEAERLGDPADSGITETVKDAARPDAYEAPSDFDRESSFEGEGGFEGGETTPEKTASAAGEDAAAAQSSDSFDEIDFGSYFDDYLDPGYKTPAAESSDKPGFETFLSSPVTLSSHLDEQLALMVLTEEVRDAADSIVGNLDENGYLTETLEDLAASGQHKAEDLQAALKAVQSCEPAGVGARDPRECLLL